MAKTTKVVIAPDAAKALLAQGPRALRDHMTECALDAGASWYDEIPYHACETHGVIMEVTETRPGGARVGYSKSYEARFDAVFGRTTV